MAINVEGTARLYGILSEHGAPALLPFLDGVCGGIPTSRVYDPGALACGSTRPERLSTHEVGRGNVAQGGFPREPSSGDILRPSVVIGHSRSGAYHGDAFGLYMFLLAGHRLLDVPGFRELHLPQEIKGYISFIPIDALLDGIVPLNLTGRASSVPGSR